MTKFEKIVLIILGGVTLSSNLIIVVWMMRDLVPPDIDLFSTLIVGPVVGLVTGLISGIYVTSYYRKRDREERIATAIYGLQIYIKKLAIRLDDILIDVKETSNSGVNIQASRNKLREELIDEPYTLFLELDDRYLDESVKEARGSAVAIILEMEKIIMQSNQIPEYLQIVQWKSDILKARLALLKNK